MRCSACQWENPSGNAFCGGCGAGLSRSCPSCEHPNPPDHRFCGRCGHRLEASSSEASPEPLLERDPRSYTPRHLAQKILRSRSALEGERKHVTVMFADVAGFTALSEPLDPEETHALMDRCFGLILEQVHRYQGTVNQFLGDGVMALFGAPVALEEAPRRAVIAALGIQSALEAFRQELRSTRSIDFRMRIGIHSGLVVVGKIGDDLRMDYTAVGDTTNLAARLQELAQPGSIVVSQATQRLLSGFFELHDLGPLEVKGRSRPVRAFEVVAERRVSSRLDATVDAGLTPLVGRDRELDSLLTAFEAAREGLGQLVFLVGEAGIGKSRLLHELRARLHREPHAWVEARCASYGQSTTFLPIVDALRRTFEIEDGDDEARAAQKLERAIDRLGGDLRWVLPFVRQLLSLLPEDSTVEDLDAATRRSETFGALNALFLQTAKRAPLVLVVEDLHWIDAASEELLRVLADSVPAACVLLIVTHRSGYVHPFGDRSYHQRIALRALSQTQIAAIAGWLLGVASLPDELRHLIAEKADGNPFFVEEVTKSLLEEGVLSRQNGDVQLTAGSEEISVPDSIQGVLMARIDRLEEEPKRAIQMASVIGREFALRLLERISDVGERVRGVVGELRALELIYEKAAHPELAFMFKHALTHDVAYESILLQRRRALHCVVGAAIEELYADRLAEHYEALASHFALGKDWERALLYRERAAEKASAAYANHAAAEHCCEALRIAEHLGESVSDERRRRLSELLGTTSMYVSEYADSGDAFLRAADCASEAEPRALNLGRAAYSYLWAHSYDRSQATANQALSLSRECGLPAGEALAQLVKSYDSAIRRGEMDLYEGVSTEVLPLAERSGNEEVLGLVLFAQGEVAEWVGDYQSAVRHLERATAIGKQHRLAHLVIWGTWFLGKATCCLGQYGASLAQLQEGLELTDRIGDRSWKARILNTLGWCFAEVGSQDRALRYNEQALDLARVTHDEEILANTEINLARSHLARGEVDHAAEYLEAMKEGFERRDPWMRWRYSLHLTDALAWVAFRRGEPERALQLVDEELVGARRHGARKIQARALTLRGQALLSLDRREETEVALVDAMSIADQIGYRPIAWRSLGLLAELARRRGETAASEQHIARRDALIEGLAASLPHDDLTRALQKSARELGFLG